MKAGCKNNRPLAMTTAYTRLVSGILFQNGILIQVDL